jgi:hypothetical protein
LLNAKHQDAVISFQLHLPTPDVWMMCRGVGREPIYVDLAAEPKIDRDNPPDLKQYADSIEPPPKEEDGPSSSSNSGSQAAAAGAAAGAAAAKPAAAAAGKSSKKGAAAGGAAKSKGQMSNDAHHIKLTNVVQRTGDIVDMVSGTGSKSCVLGVGAVGTDVCSGCILNSLTHHAGRFCSLLGWHRCMCMSTVNQLEASGTQERDTHHGLYHWSG